MTCCAMAKSFRQIRATVPFRGLAAIDSDRSFAQEEQFPTRQQWPKAEGKDEAIGWWRRRNRAPGHKEGVKSGQIII